MPRYPKFVSAQKQILTYFSTQRQRVYSILELSKILEEQRGIWKLSINTNVEKFADQLIEREILKKIELIFPDTLVKTERYLFKDASPYEIALSLRSKSYISHYSAVFLNNLTTQVPKTIYVTHEQSKKQPIGKTQLLQNAIDHAFSQPQRISNHTTKIGDYSLILLNGMYSNRAGVQNLIIDDYGIAVTNLERTLIDITVRPNYAGGIFSVLDTYRNALDKVSINKLAATLSQINFIYPYHQSIGFLLERAGYSGKQLDLLRKKNMEIDFYLTYQIEEKQYSKEWRIFYPKGM
ncbi:putative transcriptional regulator of viral defense system [Chitinophaga sp. W3I9]|uniref:type IV toxin-antitoxin system AbiEi family antitoxin domain-containing protein n=1 Tax=Chitinophaga sp. W3I9 TaxID=3373924 RepID=UPI003D25188F